MNKLMQEKMVKLKEKWLSLQPREKVAVAVGGTVVVIFIFYELVWSPILTHLDDLRKRIVSDQKTVLWMQGAEKQIQALSGKNKNATPALSLIALLSHVQKQIHAANLSSSLTQLKQTTSNTIEIHFQKVAFDKLMAWLIALVKEQPVMLKQMTMVADPSPGMVNADVVIQLG